MVDFCPILVKNPINTKEEPLEKQVALVYNLLRKVIGIEVSDCPQ